MQNQVSSVTQGLRSADRVYDQVKSMAVTYRLRPGERINEVDLARQLGVSRTPLREALNRLASEGFLHATLNRGYHVRPLEPRQVLTLYEYRATVEVGALRLAAARATDSDFDQLAAFAARSRDEPDDDRHALKLLALDEEFHESLAALSGNDEFVRSIRAINERIRFVRWIDMQSGRRAGTQAEHMRIIGSLRARDADAAASMLHSHIERRLDQIVDVIRASFAEIYTENALARHAAGKTT